MTTSLPASGEIAMTEDASTLPIEAVGRVSTIAQLAQIPEEEIWLERQKSARTAAPTGRTSSTSWALLALRQPKA